MEIQKIENMKIQKNINFNAHDAKSARRKNESNKGARKNKSTKSHTREVNLRRSRSDAGAKHSNFYGGSGLILLSYKLSLSLA